MVGCNIKEVNTNKINALFMSMLSSFKLILISNYTNIPYLYLLYLNTCLTQIVHALLHPVTTKSIKMISITKENHGVKTIEIDIIMEGKIANIREIVETGTTDMMTIEGIEIEETTEVIEADISSLEKSR